jgi:hypothetical protein
MMLGFTPEVGQHSPPIPLLVGVLTGIDVGLALGRHGINDPGELVCGGRNGLSSATLNRVYRRKPQTFDPVR